MDSYSVNCSILLTEYPLLDRPGRAKEAGFNSIELWWPFDAPVPADRDVDRLEAAIRDAGVELHMLNFAAGDMAGGDRGLCSWIGKEKDFRENVAVVVNIAERVGTRLFNVLYGNAMPDQTALSQQSCALENLAFAAEAVAPLGGTILIEPLSGNGRYPLRTAADALGVIGAAKSFSKSHNFALLADLYHLAANGDDVAAVIDHHAALFGHIQIADSPGRGAPGTGQLPLHEWLGLSSKRGYVGQIGLEFHHEAGGAFDWIERTFNRTGGNQ